jgi:MULE transposase domain
LKHSEELIDEVMALLGLGHSNHSIMEKMMKKWNSFDEATNRRNTLTLVDVATLRKRFQRVNRIHPDDSVCVAELMKREENGGLPKTVIPYHAWRDDTIHHDYCTIIMTDSGVAALNDWGQKVAFMDTTYGVNRYGYPFTALVVKDSHSNHWPVAFMIHQREDANTYIKFLTTVRARAGMLPQGIMIDMSLAGTSLTIEHD